MPAVIRSGLQYKILLDHHNSNDNHQQNQFGLKCFEWNGTKQFAKAFYALVSIAIIILITNLLIMPQKLLFFGIQQNEQIVLQQLERIGQLTCPLLSTPEFHQAVRSQNLGLFEIQLEAGQLDVNRTWTQIPEHFNRIWEKQFAKLQVLKLLADGDEYKYFIPFLPADPAGGGQNSPCTIITLGVGHTVDAERNLINLYPQCHLITADPSAEINAALTHQIGGKFVHAAIGGKTAMGQPVNVRREGTWLWFWKVQLIERQWLPQIGIADFLEKFIVDKQNPVDLLLIDIEGAEFGIFEQLALNYDKFPTPICQINIEVHDPDTLIANYSHQQFFRSLNILLRSGKFALMNTDMFTKQAPIHLFLRMFFVNIGEEKCRKKFFC
ncbi:hypothetical protein niasHS_002935 [Heterodera schachtii]|uniref:Methyltransferase FkbM domain-containing protein n=1 Tax=Heterodera schachtii TaxID=97005 RepID=A0ABD2K981_HETSC